MSDCLLIIVISFFTVLLSEGFSWILIYRTEKFKRLQAEVEKQSKKRIYMLYLVLFPIII